MPGVVMDGSLLSPLYGWQVNSTQPWLVRLFKNDHEPARGDLLSDYEECDFPNYAVQAANLGSVGGVVGGVGTLPNTIANTWVRGAGSPDNDVYGYYVTDFSGNLLFAERDPLAPVTMNDEGSRYSVILKLTARSIFPLPTPP